MHNDLKHKCYSTIKAAQCVVCTAEFQLCEWQAARQLAGSREDSCKMFVSPQSHPKTDVNSGHNTIITAKCPIARHHSNEHLSLL